jgi:hypothetical protein
LDVTTQSFQEFVQGQTARLSMPEFLLNLCLAALLALVVSWVYVRFGATLSNRRQFARNLLPLALITTLVITIVKSSLALSLGLVGALSIVRFRAAIKEPEELIYLFLAIGIGLGMGASQRGVTVIALGIVLGVVVLRGLLAPRDEARNLFLTVSSQDPHKVELSDLVRVLGDHCKSVDLKRFDESGRVLEASFLVELDDFAKLDASRAALQALGESVNVSFVDHRGLG